MKVSIVTTTYNLPYSTQRLFQTAMLDSDWYDISFWLFVHSKVPQTLAMAEELNKEYPTHLFDYCQNRGLARSWNEGVFGAYNKSADVVIVANDDVYFSAGDIDKIVTRAINYRNNYVISVAGMHGGHNQWRPTHGYSCFAINPIAIERLGCFDENIFPIYLEDIDYHRRATLDGLVEENCSDTMVFHGGSSAINHDPQLAIQNIRTQRLNIEYFKRKWESEDLNAGYKVPFNNPKFGLKIRWSDRHHPYGPGFDRDDYELEMGRIV